MELSLITVAFDPDAGAFPRAPLADIDGEIVSVVEHFFHFDGIAHLLLIVHHRPGVERSEARRKKRKGPPEDLSADELQLYQRLRAWRQGRANADGVPVYVILKNDELARIARAKPTSRQTLAAIDGIGDNKAGRYGPELLKVVADSTDADHDQPTQGSLEKRPDVDT